MAIFNETDLGQQLEHRCQLAPRVEQALDISLPAAHQSLFELCGGGTAFNGYFRLFGPGAGRFGLKNWNDVTTWKFAWPARVSEFYCFGETALGDQYAYRVEGDRIESEQVYFLDALRMEAEPLYPTFVAFLQDEFLRNATTPYDSVLARIASRLGPLPIEKHVAQVPSQLVTGIEDADSVQTLPAIDAMVFNGDLYRQIIESRRDKPVRGVEIIGDDAGRTRIQVV